MSDEDGGFFASFARSMVQRSLPAAREWMRKRLGPTADVGQVEVRGPTLVVTGARIPLGATLLFEVDRATLDIDPDAVVSGGMPVRFQRATGRVTAGELLQIPVSLVGRGGPWLDADLTATDAKWQASEVPLSGRAHVVVGPDAWRLDDLRLSGKNEAGDVESIAASASSSAGGAPSTRLDLERAHAGRLLDTWHAISGRPWNLPVPRDANVDGSVSFGAVGSRADLRLKTDRSDLSVELAAKPDGGLDAFSLSGQLDLDELATSAPWTSVWVSGGAPMRVRARLGGRMDALRGSVQLASPELRSTWLTGPVSFELAASLNDEDAALSVELGPLGHARVAATFDSQDRAQGEGTATLDPRCLSLMEMRVDAEPLEWTARVSGTRTDPRLHADTTAKQLTLATEADKLLLRALKLSLAWADGLEGRLRARVGRGSLDLQRRAGKNRVRVSRLERDDLLTAMDLAGVAGPVELLPPSTQVWADVTLDGTDVDGEIHAESTGSRLTVSPLVSRERAGLDGTMLRGSLSLADLPWLPGSAGRIALEGAIRGPRAAPYLDVSARSDELSMLLVAEQPVVVSELEANATVRRTGVELGSLSARAFGGVITARGTRADRLDAGLRIQMGEVTAADLRDGLGRWFRAVGVPIRRDPTFNLRCVDEGAGVRVQVHLGEGVSNLGAEIVVGPEGLAGSSWSGRVGLDDFDVPLTGGRLDLNGTLDGTLDRPRLCANVELVEGTALALGPLVLPIAHAVGEARVSRDRWVWSGVNVQLLGGALLSRGVLGRDTGALGELRLEDLEVGQARFDGKALRGRLAGTLEGTLRLTGPRAARGRFALHEPEYGVLAEAESILARWGLPVPPIAGRRPLRWALELEGGAMRLSEFEASVPGLRVHGDASVAADGALSGELVLDAGRSWLAQGRSLARLGHLLGGITVPIHLGGDRDQFRVVPDIRAALRIAFERLFRDVPQELPALPAHAPTSLLSTDALIDRVAAGGDDAEPALETLLERGMTPEQIADLVSKRRG